MKKTLLVICSCLALLAAGACSDDDGPNGSSSIKVCSKTCTKVDDCCAAGKDCDKGASAMACTNGFCDSVGCKTDKDCPPPAGGITLTCKTLSATIGGRTDTQGLCAMWCTKDADCPTMGPITMKCVIDLKMTGMTTAAKMCGIGCTKDADCAAMKQTCIDGKYCGTTSLSAGCKSDAECAANKDGEDKCDLSTGVCVCAADKTCQDDLSAKGGTFKCN